MSNNSNNTSESAVDENELIRQRREKLDQWRLDSQAYPNTFKPEQLASEIINQYGEIEKEPLEELAVEVSLDGSLMTRLIMGKDSFAHIQYSTAKIQIYFQLYSLT